MAGVRSAAAGWYIANTSASPAPVAGSAGRIVPWACEIRAPGMKRPIEWRPSVTTTAGSSTSSWRRRYGSHAAISSGFGVAVVGRTALDDVRDEHVLAPPADRSEQAHEQVAGAADERAALAVLVEARALADEHDLGRGIALAGHGLRPRLVEATSGARPHLAGDDLERRLALGPRHAVPPPAGSGTGPR